MGIYCQLLGDAGFDRSSSHPTAFAGEARGPNSDPGRAVSFMFYFIPFPLWQFTNPRPRRDCISKQEGGGGTATEHAAWFGRLAGYYELVRAEPERQVCPILGGRGSAPGAWGPSGLSLLHYQPTYAALLAVSLRSRNEGTAAAP